MNREYALKCLDDIRSDTSSLNWQQMQEQKFALQDGLDISKLTGDHQQMREQRLAMLKEGQDE